MAEKTEVQEKRKSAIGAVYHYLKEHPNTVVYANDVTTELPDISVSTVYTCMSRMILSPEYRVFRGPTKGSYIYYSGGNGKDLPEEKPHGATIPEEREKTTGLKPADVIPTPKPVLDYGPQIAKAERARITVRAIDDPRPNILDFVGHLNKVADIWRDTNNNLWVAMPLDQYINGKPA